MLRLHSASLAAGLTAATILVSATVAPAQTCGLRSHFRIVTNMSGASNGGERRADSGLLTTGPVVLQDSITTTSALGCSSSGNCTATSDYGSLSCVGTGTANNCPGNGVFLWLDEWIGAQPKAMFQDTLTIVSTTLPPGTPVQLRYALTLDGSAVVVDPNPAVWYAAELLLSNGQQRLRIADSAGTASGVVATTVGATIGIDGRLNVSLFAYGIMGATPMTSSYAVDLRAQVGFAVLTPGASLQTCSGRTYGTLLPGSRSVGTGCGVGPPALTSAPAVLGTAQAYSMTGAAANQPVFLGFSIGGPVPVAIGACTLYLDLPNGAFLAAGTTDALGHWTGTLAIPAWPSLVGGVITAQALPLRPGGALLGIGELSNALVQTLGL